MVAKAGDSSSWRVSSPRGSVGKAMGEDGTVRPPCFSVAAFTETVSPDGAWAGGGNRVADAIICYCVWMALHHFPMTTLNF